MIDWYWASWADFGAMGGYARYVWAGFGMTAAALALELWTLRRQRRAIWAAAAAEAAEGEFV